MALWETPRARKAFGTTVEFARANRVLAANQGLYNGFLAAGLLWALWLGVGEAGLGVALFFLGCVLVAALYGAYSVNKRIFFVQGVPAIAALIAVWCLTRGI
jgi:putative membrane protein